MATPTLACRNAEGWRPVSRLRDFDLTPCFEEGIILPLLLVSVLVASVVRIWSLKSVAPYEREQRFNVWLLRLKVIFGLLLALASLATVGFVYVTDPAVAVPQTYILEFLAFSLLPVLSYLNHERTRRSSTILLLFWPVYFLYLVIWSRTTLSHAIPPIPPVVALKWAYGGLGLIVFALECAGPEYKKELVSEKIKESPLLTANIFSIWTFGWLTPLMKKGVQQFITEDDLPPLLPEDESSNLGRALKKALERHRSLWMALFSAYGGPYMVAAALKLTQDCLAFLQPQLLRLFLSYISKYQSSHSEDGSEKTGPSPVEGFAITVAMFAAAVGQSVIVHQYFQRCFETGMRVRAGLVTAIYQKSLVLSPDERGRATGDIVNLMSVDTTRMQDLCTYGLMAISGPLQITLAFVSLYNLLGWSAFVGVAIMIFSIPLNTVIARLLKRLQEKQMKNRDKRTRLMSELLANIKSIKLYAWEYAFIRRILFVRNDLELKMMRKIAIFSALNSTLWIGIPLLVAFSSFATAALTSSRPLTADIIFPAISLFNLLQFPLAMIAQVMSNIIEAFVSVKRLSNFLRAEELPPDTRKLLSNPYLCDNDPVVEIVDGEFIWNKNALNPTLEDMNLTVRKGELVGVLGRVGAGKTSLLSAIIGDMYRVDGELTVYGTIAYAPQNPWIMSATIKDNILFFHEYDETFYNLVLDACALRPDLELMTDGDLTEVGERGITLSGGQRARISLARVVYARADLILLDDVLAAVDSHVARHVFDQVIGPYGLLASKSRILVTNSVSFIRQFDNIVYLRRGIILESGPYGKLIADNDSELSKLIRGHGNTSMTASGTTTPYTAEGSATPSNGQMTIPGTPMEDTTLTAEKIETLADRLGRKKSFQRAKVVKEITLRTASMEGQAKEYSAQGRVKTEVYWRYIKAASKAGFTLFLLGTILQQAMGIFANVALKSWGEHNRQSGSNRDAGKFLAIYGLLSLSSTILSGLAAIILWVLCSLRSSKQLHDSMLHSVMRAPLSFFELTPSGRIMNLFSRDVYVVDQVLARVIQSMFRTLVQCAGIIVVIGVSFPAFLIAVPPLGWFYAKIMKYYLATSRELKRLDAISRSPIFAWFSESLNGISTIRAFGLQSVFTTLNECRVDRNQICYLPSIAVNRWLALRLEFVGAVIIFIASILAMVTLLTSSIDAGLVGLVLTYALNMTSSLNWVVRSASEVEQNIVSVERILHYIELEPEAPYEIPDAVPDNWPSEGKIEFREYSLKYRPELDPVLNHISLTIEPAEKVGVCGRTGAGKSSLLLALFRIIEPATGTIYIDGIDITKIGLRDLRSAVSIVPQSPDLFEGTIRENIDPVGEHQDADIWTALSQAHLKEYIESLPEKLDAPVREGGSSLSSGQRQLICFARALLRKSKILVLDEATSAVDLETDQAIQDIIRGEQFAHVTMLTIAHRLNTIIDSDRVLVLDAGKIAEFDSPKNLLETSDTKFRSLAVEAGLA